MQMCEAGVDACTVCDDPDSKYGVDLVTGKCVECRLEHCANCQDDASVCRWCNDGYWNDQAAGLCTVCKGSCARCSTNMEGEEECDWCLEGFEFDDEDSAGRKCIPVAS